MKRKKVGLYDPYLDTLGGGEKHILQIIRVLADEGYEVNIFWDKNLKKELNDKFSFRFINQTKFVPNIFYQNKSFTVKINTLKNYDYFFYVTDGSYFFSAAKNNFIFCMVPQKSLYNFNFMNKLKTVNYRFTSNSKYTHDWLKKWGLKNRYIYPYVDDRLITNHYVKKEKIILTVGRFFPQLHTKQYEILIDTFKRLKNNHRQFKDYKLILAGGLKKEDEDYFYKLKNSAKNDPSIIFKTNPSLGELYKLYKLSNFYWHFTGFGVDEYVHPEMVEHLGITPIEAMAAGAIVFCYAAGGPKEIVKNGSNGYLFSSQTELINKMFKIVNDDKQQSAIRYEANGFIKNNFRYDTFKTNVKNIILRI